MKKIILLLLTASCFFSFSPGTNYRAHYGEDFENALLFLHTHKRVFKSASENYGIDEKMLKSRKNTICRESNPQHLSRCAAADHPHMMRQLASHQTNSRAEVVAQANFRMVMQPGGRGSNPS